MTVPDLEAVVRRWIRIDDEYGDELERLADGDDAEQLGALFDGRIAFGTAGLRAPMGPGPQRMNRVVVRQTTSGLMAWLGPAPTVVVGYDARHRSKTYADEVVAVVSAHGGRAELIDVPAPTPVLARAVLDRSADAGVMITASHNPAADNGYKLYLADGIQLVAPADAEIAAAIDQAAEHELSGAGDQWPVGADANAARHAVRIDTEALATHRDVATAALATAHREVGVLYTAMHGVGGRHLLGCFEAAGFPTPHVVDEQFEPDPDFPTAPFPNPEEPAALDLAFAAARRLAAEGARLDVILANDPDADRLAVAVTDPTGAWRRLTGDEVGALLIDHVIRHRRAGVRPDGERAPAIVASSIVSSRFIDAIAAANDVTSIRTLTGFKWVARPIVDRPEAEYLLGYEEALGYCIGDGVRDKDGISAALVMAELAAGCRADGITVHDQLDRLVERYGLYATAQVTVRFDHLDTAARAELMERAVSLAPDRLGGALVIDREDLSMGERLPPTAGVVLGLDDGARVIVRPSGTEPKIKAYLEVVSGPGQPGTAAGARQAASARLAELGTAVEALLVD